MVRFFLKFVRHFFVLSLPLGFSACIPELPAFIEGKKVSLDAELTMPINQIDFLTQSVRSRTYRFVVIKKDGNLKSASDVHMVKVPEGFGFRGGAYPGTNGTCGEAISETCTLELSFEPQSNIPYAGKMVLSYQGRNEQKFIEISLKGKGTDNASLKFSLDGFDPIEGDLNFGTFGWGTHGERRVHVLYFGVYEATNVNFDLPSSPFYEVSNSCPADISANCEIVLKYEGQVEGWSQDALRMTFNNGAFPDQSQVKVKGFTTDQVHPATLTISDESWDRKLINDGIEYRTFTLARTVGSGVNATSLQVPALGDASFRYKGGSYPGTGGTCGNFVAGPCTVVIGFNPTSIGTKTGALAFSYFDGITNQTVSRPLSGRGVTPAVLTLTPITEAIGSPRDFGSVSIAWHKDLKFRVANSNDSMDATSINFSFAQGVDFAKQAGCSTTLGEGANCDVTIRFTPGEDGTLTDTLRLNWDDAKALQQISFPLTGHGDPRAFLRFRDATKNFQQVLISDTKDVTLTIERYGTMQPTGVSIGLSSGTIFTFDEGGGFPGGGTCNGALYNVANRNCTYVVQFAPTNDQDYTDTITLNYGDGDGASLSATQNLLGKGGSPADLEIQPATGPVAFGSTPRGKPSPDQTFTIQNKAGTDVSATSVVFTPPAGYERHGGSCGASIAKEASCTVKLRLTGATVGTQNGNLTVTYDNGLAGGQSASRSVTGAVTPEAVLEITQSTIDFGNVVVGNTNQKTVSVKYYGSHPATLATFPPVLPSRFSYTGGTCTGTITGDCNLDVTFAPNNSTPVSGPLTLTYHDGSVGGKTVGTTLSGQGQTPATLSFALASYAFPNTTVNSTKDVTLTLNRTGDVAATGMNLSGIAAPFTKVNGGSCNTSLTGASCTVKIRFSPLSTTAGSTPLSITMNYTNGATAQSTSISLTGTATDAAKLDLTGANFASISAFGNTDREVVVTNNGTTAATSLSVSGIAAPFSQYQPTTCGATLAAGSTCKVFVRYQSTRPEANAVDVRVDYYDSQGNRFTEHTLQARAIVPVQVATNGGHTCATNDIAQVKCWGENQKGQLGQGNTAARGDQGGEMGTNLPIVPLSPSRYAIKIAAGYEHACAILDNDDLLCWGDNAKGQLGAGSSAAAIGDQGGEVAALSPVNLGAGVHAVEMALGAEHSCALLNTGNVKCWGKNDQGQLGLGDKISRGRTPSEMGNNLPIVALGATATEITASAGHTCARLVGGTVKCWGDNYYAQLGTGDSDGRGGADDMTSLAPISLGTGRTAVSISAGGGFTCAALDNGQVKCWGRNDASGNLGYLYCEDGFGQAGLCTDAAFSLETRYFGFMPSQMGNGLRALDLPPGAVRVRAGTSHACATFSDNSVRCWGDNAAGQLGQGDTDARGFDQADMGAALTAVAVAPGFQVQSLSTHHHSVCVTATQGSISRIYCWGANNNGALGQGHVNTIGDDTNEMGSDLSPVSF